MSGEREDGIGDSLQYARHSIDKRHLAQQGGNERNALESQKLVGVHNSHIGTSKQPCDHPAVRNIDSKYEVARYHEIPTCEQHGEETQPA
jgi:hypothetical protein